MRGLKERFIEDLQSGKLAWFLQEVKQNTALFLSVEKNALSIYYKGNSMVSIRAGGGYNFTIQEKFFTTEALKEEYAIFNRDKKAVGVYQRKFPVLLEAVDTSYESQCTKMEECRQQIATKNPYVLAMDYELPESLGGVTLDMFGIHQGKLLAIQHNLGQNIGRVAPVYEAMEKLWANPEEKEKLLQSARTIAENLVSLGLLDSIPPLTEESLHFVALLTDCDVSFPEGSIPLQIKPVTAEDIVIDIQL